MLTEKCMLNFHLMLMRPPPIYYQQHSSFLHVLATLQLVLIEAGVQICLLLSSIRQWVYATPYVQVI